jgi:signal transduction histidine kinase
MKKVALVFVLAVLLPSLVLAWLAVRSLRDQQFLLERQQSLLYQRVTDALAKDIADYLAQRQQEFSAQVESLMGGEDPRVAGTRFDGEIRQHWPLAEVGFCVTLSGKILSPAPNERSEAQVFRRDNSSFLGNREPVEVYANATRNDGQGFNRAGQNQALANNFSSGGFGAAGRGGNGLNNLAANSLAPSREFAQAKEMAAPAGAAVAPQEKTMLDGATAAKDSAVQQTAQNAFNYKPAQVRKVSPQSQPYQLADRSEAVADESQNNLSRVIPAEAEFRQLIGSESEGMIARFLQNKLKLMFWHRLNRDPDLIFGAELNLDRVVADLRGLVQAEPALRDEVFLALLDDNARPVAVSRADFRANWKRPFVATEIGEALPHWEVAAYLLNPARLTQAAQTAKLTLGLLIAVLVFAIGIGSWLIVSSLNSELKRARQKTDFVSNVSHELKTPLTSIRMFSELLAEGRVTDAAKQRSYLNIISAEAARLARLINNVLDFSRLERGEKKYHFQSCNLVAVVHAVAETFRPHLETNGFQFTCTLPAAPLTVRGDSDALSQIVVNLLSNAEKYSPGQKEIFLQVAAVPSPLPHAEIRVLDRGLGVPRGSEEKIFEEFYRAHDALSSGIQGSGLGLTIARQIARAHGGEVVYEPRAGGGSCFVFRLPISEVSA